MMADPPPPNPYPGLRPFEPEDAELFFGRERETDELRRRLRTTRFLAVVGSSGTGKSSLVRCGLIPSLHGGFMAGAGTSWRVAISRPGEDPIGRLADALDHPALLGSSDADSGTRRTLLEVTLRDSSLGLAEAVRQARLPAGVNVLVLVDQFEELFRFRRSRATRAGADDAATFVRLLIEAASRDDLPIFVVITMRSEFVGECVAFDRLPGAINAGQYLVPRMSRDALRAAITGPAAVRDAAIAPRLLARLLNEVGDDLDRLPVLQHALMRTWDAWAHDHAAGEPLDVRHYEAVGTMREALSRHADEAWAELTTEPQRRIAERLFKTLTETTEDGHGLRRPTPAQRLTEVCATDLPGLEQVVDRFRAPGRAFLQPPAGIPLQRQDVVDLSHESLMRVWTRLAGWVREEARAVDIYRRLARSSAQHAAGEASLWRPPELTLGLRWLRDTRPTAAWAGDDDTSFQRAMRFLRRSRQAHRRRIALAAAGAVTVVALAIGWFYTEAARERMENESLRKQVLALKSATASERQGGATQSRQVQALRERHTDLTATVDALQRTRGELGSAVAELRDANRRLEAELARVAAETERLENREEALDQEFRRLSSEQEDLSARLGLLERAAPALGAQVAALEAQVDGLSERSRELNRLLRETLPCPRASMRPPPAPPPPAGVVEEQPSGAGAPPSAAVLPPDPATSDALRRQIAALTQELARLVNENARQRDEAAFLERENALLDRQRALLLQENERLEQERQALEARQRALDESVADAEAARKALAETVEAAEKRNRAKAGELTATRGKHRELEARTVSQANAIASLQARARDVGAGNERVTAILQTHVERLLAAARGGGEPPDVAALLALKAWRWAPYDTDDPAHPAVYNTLWQVLHRVDERAARELIAPGDPARGKLATTRSESIATALCARVSRPLTEEEWRRFMPEGACFTPEAARPCQR